MASTETYISQKKVTPNVVAGQDGEDVARKFLQLLGYEVRASNLRLGRDEIDILAFDPIEKCLVFAEVKARRSQNADYRPELNLTWRKKRAMARAARHWIMQHEYEGAYRMDLLCVAAGRVVDHWKELEWV